MIRQLTDFYAKRSKRERLVLGLTFLVVMILLVDRLIVEPVFSKARLIDNQIRDEETAIKKSLHVLLRKDQISKESKEYEAFSVEAKNSEEEMTALLKEIEVIANKSSVSLLYVKPGTTEENGGIKKYSASLECEAQMPEIASFFLSVESSLKLLQIEKYEIQPKNKESSIARCTVTISRTVLLRS